MSRLRRGPVSCVWILVVFLSLVPARAEVVRVEIDHREPFAGGHVFGRTGPYEIVAGRLHLEVDPRNNRGRVECWSDFFVLKPVDPLRGNRRILYDVNNRGNKLALWTFNGARGNNPSILADVGNGFLMHQGYSVLWCGWCGDVMADGTDRLLLGVPVARQNGEPITGPIHVEISVDERAFSRPFFWSLWGTSDAYPAASLDDPTARLMMRPDPSQPAVEVPRERWSFARHGHVVCDLPSGQFERIGVLARYADAPERPRDGAAGRHVGPIPGGCMNRSIRGVAWWPSIRRRAG